MRTVLEAKPCLTASSDELVPGQRPQPAPGVSGAARVVGYKLPVPQSRIHARSRPRGAFGDDAEADAFIYSLYADLIAGRVDEAVLGQVPEAAQVYPTTAPASSPLARHPQGLTRCASSSTSMAHPPAYFVARAAVVGLQLLRRRWCCYDGHLDAGQVARGVEMVRTAGYNLVDTEQPFQDPVPRLALQAVAAPLLQAPEGALQGS
jgi:hypothetical protein